MLIRQNIIHCYDSEIVFEFAEIHHREIMQVQVVSEKM